ncbi:hypothetical protein OGK28_001521 [Staphylococcus pseudintermedius]|nr:hypothetical protein [Staphylococcus pseudintermedius]EGQ1649595.1 hypothetical protein [Staphylococcus pseudintermedius]EGQ2756524.1 hypothetical protein [Staphylococcus pseudintermedius]EGQ2766983.1 hypothetical protein [Staphylococcus pseudintermedius]EGQ2788832.1 hypothetical protein [Staphylococcus pseudintermedius]
MVIADCGLPIPEGSNVLISH